MAMVNWEDMSDEMLRDLVAGLPRMMRPWKRVSGSREVALWECEEFNPSGKPRFIDATAEVALSFSSERDMVVWRWAAGDGEGPMQRGESFNRQRAMAEAEEYLRSKGFRFLPPDTTAPVMALVKGER